MTTAFADSIVVSNRNTNGGVILTDVQLLLTQFSLTRQEAAVYIALLGKSGVTGYEIAKTVGISRSNAYTALAGLAEKGAAYSCEGKVTRYSPVPVEEFCANKLRQLRKAAKTLEEALPRAESSSAEYFTITGEHIANKAQNMLTMAQERAYISAPSAVISQYNSELADAISRGLKIVVITDPPYKLAGAIVCLRDKAEDYFRLITDSKYVLTGNSAACVYSSHTAMVDLVKEALTNEMKLIELNK